MGRMLVIVTLLLGGACPVQLPSSHVILTSTQTLYDSYLISCTPAIPEEKVTQVHWKERRPDGKYNVIAVLNTVWGNATQLSYQLIVKLSKIDETTYTLEIAEAVRVVCCEVVTFPSGIVQENCLVLEGDSTPGGGNIESALLGTLLVSGFLVFGCLVLICHICWSKRSSRRTLNLSSTSREAWNRVERSRVPYTRTTPSVNHAYEPPIDADLLANEEAQRSHLPRAAPANQPAFEGPPTRVSHQYQITPPSNHWLSENSPNLDAPSYTASASVPPPRMNVIPEESSTENSIYSNVLRHNRPHQKMPHLQHSQNKPDVEQHQPQIFAHVSLPQPSPGNPFHTPSSSWQCGGTSIFSEGAGALQPTRLRVPRTPDSPFSTINPMYHSRPVWAPHPSNDSFNYEQTTIS